MDSMNNNRAMNQHQQNHHNGGSVDVESWFCSIMVVLLMLILGSVVVDSFFVASRIVLGPCFGMQYLVSFPVLRASR